LLKSLYAYKGQEISELNLAREAIRIEREVLKEPVGWQDQTFAAFGGFNLIKFHNTNEISVNPVPISKMRKQQFEEHLMLFFTGIKRRSNEITPNHINKIDVNKEILLKMRQMVDVGYHLLINSANLEEFGKLLDKSWKLKKSLDNNISNEKINAIYQDGIVVFAFLKLEQG